MTAEALTAPEPSHSAGARVKLGASTFTPAHVLTALASDSEVTVRAAVAMNPACPPHVDATMSRDPDDRVRALLARKLALLAPTLSRDAHSQACMQVLATLEGLATDATVRVRAALADCVKAMPDAPRSLVMQLAQDGAAPVSEPVIRLSPLLTDADLLAILASPPTPGAQASIASRAGLSAAMADAVAARADPPAVQALLANHTAAIQEATLDALIARAEPHVGWHAPLVARPALTPGAARALAGFVAGTLIDALAARPDMPPDLAAELRSKVAARMDNASPPRTPESEEAELLASLRRLDAAGALTEASLIEAARAGDPRRVAAILSVASGVPMDAVQRAGALRNARGLISLAWKAGFSMRAGTVAQAMLGQLGPGAATPPGAGGVFPLSVDEMTWQLELLALPAR